MITFRHIVHQALANALRKTENPKEVPGILAVELRTLFRVHGYAVRRVLPNGDIGREMTHGEQIAVGLIPAGTPDPRNVPSVLDEDDGGAVARTQGHSQEGGVPSD